MNDEERGDTLKNSQHKPLVRRRIRSPRSAAIAGILFALMRIISLILISSVSDPTEFSMDWLESLSGTSSVVVLLVVFSGIAFLWFTGVIRDLIGEREDHFFATIFFGSGILYVALGFVWAAIFGAILGNYSTRSHLLADIDIYILGFAVMNEIISNYALRMTGVYMLSINTLWARVEVDATTRSKRSPPSQLDSPPRIGTAMPTSTTSSPAPTKNPHPWRMRDLVSRAEGRTSWRAFPSAGSSSLPGARLTPDRCRS